MPPPAASKSTILPGREELEALIGRRIERFARVEGGLINQIFRLESRGESLTLRIFSRGEAHCEKELRLLERIGRALPVPAVIKSGPSFILSCWIEGTTLSEFRRAKPAGELLRLAQPLGALAATVASFDGAGLKADRSASGLLENAPARLQRGVARDRLGAPLADALLKKFASFSLPDRSRLVHGDFGGRNILVSPEGNLAALIDWDDAFAGSPLFDLGSFFRYPRRFSEPFRDGFARGYRDAGGALEEDWWSEARLLDASRQLATLESEEGPPEMIADIVELMGKLATPD